MEDVRLRIGSWRATSFKALDVVMAWQWGRWEAKEEEEHEYEEREEVEEEEVEENEELRKEKL
jgi:hypothetical protein